MKKQTIPTNGDEIRTSTDEELSNYFAVLTIGLINQYSSEKIDLNEESIKAIADGYYQWLKMPSDTSPSSNLN